MRILLDTNIIIHREANTIVKQEIGVLFNWMDKLNYEKCIHPASITEIKNHADEKVVKTFDAKVQNYNLLRTLAPETDEIARLRAKHDSNENDQTDTSLLSEVFCHRVDFLITEDRKILSKSKELGIHENVFTIDTFLEKVTTENPDLSDYKTLSVRKEYFGNINLDDSFFDTFKEDYEGFENWFNKKSDAIAYICLSEDNEVLAFLYVKIEGKGESYGDINPTLLPKKRLKIGTFKVISNGYKLGERFLKVVFDNALANRVDEIYVTLFNESDEQGRLIGLLEDWGFTYHGVKSSESGEENVYIKNFRPIPDQENPKRTYPFITYKRRFFLVPIYPEYHTELLPDSILNNESERDYIENEPHRNAIQKVYISRSFNRDLKPGDIILFYRTGGLHKSVVTTIGVIEDVKDGLKNESEFIQLCRKRSVFSDSDLAIHWNYRSSRPFIVNFLYLYSLPKRPNMKKLIDLGVISDINSAPRGFEEISLKNFHSILKASETDDSFIIN